MSADNEFIRVCLRTADPDDVQFHVGDDHTKYVSFEHHRHPSGAGIYWDLPLKPLAQLVAAREESNIVHAENFALRRRVEELENTIAEKLAKGVSEKLAAFGASIEQGVVDEPQPESGDAPESWLSDPLMVELAVALIPHSEEVRHNVVSAFKHAVLYGK